MMVTVGGARWVALLIALAGATACLANREKRLHYTAASAQQSPARPAVQHSYTVRGRVRGADGVRLLLAHARLLDLTGQVVAQTRIAVDGRFELADRDVRGSVAWLEITAVDHRQTRTLVAPELLDVDISMGTYAAASPAAPAITVFEGKRMLDPVPMSALPDGTYTVEIDNPKGTLRYELTRAVGENRIVNGTMSDAYEYDGGGDYISVIKRPEPTVRIVYDPSRRPRAGLAGQVHFSDPNSASAQIQEISELLLGQVAHSPTNGRTASNTEGALIEPDSVDPKRKLALALNSTSSSVRRAALVASLRPEPRFVANAALSVGSTPTSAQDAPESLKTLARKALVEVEPTDLVWALEDAAFMHAIQLCGGEEQNADYVSEFVRAQPAPAPVACYLADQIKLNRDKPGRVRRLQHMLASERFAASKYSSAARALLMRSHGLVQGRPLPDFKATSLDGQAVYSPSALRGRLYLLELWATWCGPCVAAMPALHDAYEKYGQNKQRPLHILSISLDDDADEVTEFRASKWPMPWSHAVATTSEQRQLTATFGAGIPFYALVDEQGNVIASSPELHAQELSMLLEQMLGI